MAEEIVRETITRTSTVVNITEEDKEVARLYTDVVRRGLEYARWVLDWGMPGDKLRIATAAMSSAARLAAVDAKSEIEEHRLEFERMMDDITSVAEPERVITGPDAPPAPPNYEFIDAQSTPLAIGPHDKN